MEMLDQLYDVREPAHIFDIEVKLTATAAGLIVEQPIWEAFPLGYQVTLHRWHVNAPGATPAAPLSNAAYYLMFYRNDSSQNNLFMFFPVSGTQIAPVVVEEGSSGGRVLRGGSQIVVVGGGFPANQVIYINLQVKLERLDDRSRNAT